LLARDDVDAVLICTPTSLHATITVAAARAGKHIFCEKPMAMTCAECERMIAASDEAKVLLQIGYVLRFSTERGRIRKAILDGEIGRPVFWREFFNVSAGPSQKWVHEERTGGGPLWENSHILDAFLHTFGPPTEVCGVAARLKPEKTTALDSAAVLLKFPLGDIALFTDSFAFSGFGFNRKGCRLNQCQLDVIGSKGLIEYPAKGELNALAIFCYDHLSPEGETYPWTSDWGADGYQSQMEHFVECVRSGRTPACSGRDAIQTIRLAELVVKSIEEGKSACLPNGLL
jgi:predicted dehydrogenase